jgi:hypothetical protein
MPRPNFDLLRKLLIAERVGCITSGDNIMAYGELVFRVEAIEHRTRGCAISDRLALSSTSRP